jgi:hypothetical protein
LTLPFASTTVITYGQLVEIRIQVKSAQLQELHTK